MRAFRGKDEQCKGDKVNTQCRTRPNERQYKGRGPSGKDHLAYETECACRPTGDSNPQEAEEIKTG